MTTYNYLRKAVEHTTAQGLKDTILYIKNGFYPSWAQEHHTDRERGIKEYSTPKAWENYKAGKLTRAEAIEKASKRAAAEWAKRKEEYLQKITAAENAPLPSSINIAVDWVRNRTWGYNPNANICVVGVGCYDGSASGCGYDKRTAAIATALNKSAAALKILYEAEEKRLKGIKTRKQARRDVLGYGTGYGVLPYFEGGVGISAYYTICENCGYKMTDTASSKTFDGYLITAKKA